jgi:hypothetical protein
MKRFTTIRQMYAVLGSLNQKEAGYIMGVIDQPYIRKREIVAGKFVAET